MTPIINPWFFYFLSFADAFKIISVVAAILVPVIFIICVIEDADSKKSVLNSNDKKWMFKVSVFLILLAMLLPSKETLLTMQIASLVTEENLTGAYDIIINTTQTILGNL